MTVAASGTGNRVRTIDILTGRPVKNHACLVPHLRRVAAFHRMDCIRVFHRRSLRWDHSLLPLGHASFFRVFTSLLKKRCFSVGRKVIVFPSMLCMDVLGIVSTLAPTYASFLVIRFFQGFFFTVRHRCTRWILFKGKMVGMGQES